MKNTYLITIKYIYFREEAIVLFEPHLSLIFSFPFQKYLVIQIKLRVSLTLSEFPSQKFHTKPVLDILKLRTI
jgi:hypothetical protein